MTAREIRKQAVFGGADGVTLAIGLIVSLTGQPHAIVRAALAAGLAELVGMSAGSWLSDGGDGIGGLWGALANGAAAFAACVVPALPYLAASNAVALATSLTLTAAVAGVIAIMREERGVRALATTYGVLLLAALACWGASLI